MGQNELPYGCGPRFGRIPGAFPKNLINHLDRQINGQQKIKPIGQSEADQRANIRDDQGNTSHGVEFQTRTKSLAIACASPSDARGRGRRR